MHKIHFIRDSVWNCAELQTTACIEEFYRTPTSSVPRRHFIGIGFSRASMYLLPVAFNALFTLFRLSFYGHLLEQLIVNGKQDATLSLRRPRDAPNI